jgi:hypothetical protein
MKNRRSGSDQNRDDAQRAAAQALAVEALAFLAAEPERIGRFLALTGIGPDALRTAARDPDFLNGVLEYVTGDEPLLLEFAEHVQIKPGAVERARATLGGTWERDMP